ncbi:MAG: D-alanyl-D-alanine carboxypeptidase [Gammaproteobacteria bacterium]|nr:D-alanyl-D-alanine carboxypeptidase [Gammaproteobacteria bacterium]
MLKSILFLLFTIFPLSSATAAPKVTPSPPRPAATSYIMIDALSGQTITEKQSHKRLEPASLTKIMTGYVIFYELHSGQISLSDDVLISSKAWKTPGSKMFIEVDKRVTVENLIKGMVIQSGNDASVALAEHVAGSEDSFASLMNQHAAELGMKDSHFMNSTGLPAENHYTTAYDMALLARALISNFPEEYNWYSQKEYTFNKITQKNRNKLLFNDETVDGIKTGHTEAAGYCLVSSALRDEMRLITVVMGASSSRSRAQESQKLLNFGFRFYESHRLYSPQQTLKEVRVWKGSQEQISLGLDQEMIVTLPRGEYENLEASISVEKTLIAPIAAGDRVGTVILQLNGEQIKSLPLIALQSVTEGGIFQKIKDHILMLFE